MSIRHRLLIASILFAASPQFLLPGTSSYAAQPTGEVGLRELTALALQNDPKIIALRLQIPVAEAEKRNVKASEWRDPELRIGFSKDSNIQLDQPYERSGSVTETTRGGNNRTSSGGSKGTERESGSSTERRTTTYKETVTPGRNSDRITRTETERRSTNGSSTKSDLGGSSSEKFNETETFRSTRDETRFDSRDRFARDQTTSAKIRFWIPKPWEMKALVNQAAKEVELANYEVLAAEREVILEVRDKYEELQYLYKRLNSSRGKIAVIEKHVAKEQEILAAGGEFTIDQLSFEAIEIPALKLEIQSQQMELNNAKRQLAAQVGLADGSRIRVTDKLLRSTINLMGTDLDYLTRMAFVHRGEVGILKHEKAIVESELDIIKAKKIPWLSFVEAAYAKDKTGGHHTNDNYGVQFGVVLPLFSWLAKDEEVVQARIKSYYGSLEANQKNIANQVAEAFRSVKEAANYRRNVEGAINKYGKKIDGELAKLEASDDIAAKERLRYDIEVERDKYYKFILAADRLYNKSLITLEKALGADLDQIFNYKFEPVAGATIQPGETLAAAAPSAAPPKAPKAKAIPKRIVLKSDKNKPKPAATPAKRKRTGLFDKPKDSDSKKRKRSGFRRGFGSGR